MNINKRLKTFKLISSLLLLAGVLSLNADDTEIFEFGDVNNSNVLFVMDNSTSMNEDTTVLTTADEIMSVVSTPTKQKHDGVSFDLLWQNNFRTDRTDQGNIRNGELVLGYNYRGDGRRLSESPMSSNRPAKQEVAIVFPKVNIPENATIRSAYIQFTSGKYYARDMNNTANFTIALQNLRENGSCRKPRRIQTNSNNIKNRPRYSSIVNWNNVPVWSGELLKTQDQQTPDLAPLLNLALTGDASCWSRWGKDGNLVFFVNGAIGSRAAKAYDFNSGNAAPELHIEYSKAGIAKTRLEVMKSALKQVLKESPDTLNVGIMNYGDTTDSSRVDRPNGIRFPVKPITDIALPIVEDAITVNGAVDWALSNTPRPEQVEKNGQMEDAQVRDYLVQIVDEWHANGETPIVDALYEASLYFRGDVMSHLNATPGGSFEFGFGFGKASDKYSSHPSSYEGTPIAEITVPNSCNQPPRTETAWTQGKIDAWRLGQRGVCPADPANPSGPGSAANCRGTEFDCRPYTSRECSAYSESLQCIEWNGPSTTRNRCSYRVCVDEPKNAPNYISPIVSECQSNNIVLMSDGKPEYVQGMSPRAERKIEALTGASCAGSSPEGFTAGACGHELADYLANNDQKANVPLINTIITQVISFALQGSTPAEIAEAQRAEDYLKTLVTADDPSTHNTLEGYYTANNQIQLANAFKDVLDKLAGKQARSQSSPGYSVSVKSGLEHEDYIYVPVFDKNANTYWPGNLKKFYISDDGTTRRIQGHDGLGGFEDAMNEIGQFLPNAWDLWSASATADGNVVEGGGTASLLTNPAARNLFTTNNSNQVIPLTFDKIEDNNLESEFIDVAGLTSNAIETEVTKLVNYVRGWKGGVFDNSATPKGEARLHMGDMLHSEPVVISHTDGEQYIFAGTNEGYLHAFDTATGEEIFAFMPKELLKNIEKQHYNRSPDGHIYGLDGNITYYQGKFDGETTDRTVVFFGLRRGGSSYYALDITDMANPELLWTINSDSPGYSRLGQTWAVPNIATILRNGARKTVVVFTGGHDAVTGGMGNDYYGNSDVNDAAANASITASNPSTVGSDIFIVDALQGGLPLWKLSDHFTDVRHSIPGGARILDVNRNGLLDRLYFADTGGYVWRLDLDESLSGSSTLTTFASLGGTQNRKFYNEPDVARVRVGGKVYFTVSIGSGIRPHPMNKVITDNMFVLLDKSPYAPLPTNYSPITSSNTDLANITITNTISTVAGREIVTSVVTKDSGWEGKKITSTDKKGWKLNLPDIGEKVLSPSITFEGNLIFTTLAPVSLQVSTDQCAVRPKSQGRIYVMDLLTGEASLNLDASNGNTDINDNDISSTISANEIPGSPQTIFNGVRCSGGDCTQAADIRIGKKLTQVQSNNIADIESIYWSDPEGK